MEKTNNRENFVNAHELGLRSPTELLFIIEGKLAYVGNGNYEIFSSADQYGSGEKAEAGDYFIIKEDGYPQHFKKEEFLATHLHIGGSMYRKI